MTILSIRTPSSLFVRVYKILTTSCCISVHQTKCLTLMLQAISALNNVIPEGSNQPLTVRVAEEHGKQKATQFYNSTMNMNMNMMNSMHYPAPSNVMHRGRARFRFQNISPYWETFSRFFLIIFFLCIEFGFIIIFSQYFINTQSIASLFFVLLFFLSNFFFYFTCRIFKFCFGFFFSD